MEHTSGLGQRWISAGPGFPAFISFLAGHGHNFTLLWRVEMPKFCSLPVTQSSPPDFTVSPQPWQRTGPGKATDDGLKFDLTKFDPELFRPLAGEDASSQQELGYTRGSIYSPASFSTFSAAQAMAILSPEPITSTGSTTVIQEGRRGRALSP